MHAPFELKVKPPAWKFVPVKVNSPPPVLRQRKLLPLGEQLDVLLVSEVSVGAPPWKRKTSPGVAPAGLLITGATYNPGVKPTIGQVSCVTETRV